ILVRLDAGDQFGLGHLSRCITLCKAFDAKALFLIRTDNRDLVRKFFNNNTKGFDFEILYLKLKKDINYEIHIISQHFESNDILIIDHYEADEQYQIKLRNSGFQ